MKWTMMDYLADYNTWLTLLQQGEDVL